MPFYEDYVKDFTMDYYEGFPFPNAGMHIHPQYELLVVLESSNAEVTINGQVYSINQPFAALCSPFSLHHMAFFEKSALNRYIYYFDDAMINNHPDEFKDFQKYRQSTSVFFTFSTEFAEKLKPLQKEAWQNRNTSIITKLLFLITLQLILNEESVQVYLQTNSEIGQTNQIVRYMIEHFSEDLTAETVAQKFFISRSKLYRDFQDYTTISFRQFLIELRISKAKFLLKSGLDIREVATAVGFDNESYFCQFFKKNIGITPLQFAKKVGKETKRRANL